MSSTIPALPDPDRQQHDAVHARSPVQSLVEQTGKFMGRREYWRAVRLRAELSRIGDTPELYSESPAFTELEPYVHGANGDIPQAIRRARADVAALQALEDAGAQTWSSAMLKVARSVVLPIVMIVVTAYVGHVVGQSLQEQARRNQLLETLRLDTFKDGRVAGAEMYVEARDIVRALEMRRRTGKFPSGFSGVPDLRRRAEALEVRLNALQTITHSLDKGRAGNEKLVLKGLSETVAVANAEITQFTRCLGRVDVLQSNCTVNLKAIDEVQYDYVDAMVDLMPKERFGD